MRTRKLFYITTEFKFTLERSLNQHKCLHPCAMWPSRTLEVRIDMQSSYWLDLHSTTGRCKKPKFRCCTRTRQPVSWWAQSHQFLQLVAPERDRLSHSPARISGAIATQSTA